MPAHEPDLELGLIRLPALSEQLGFSPHTIRRWTRLGEFPRPFRVTEGSPDVWRIKDVAAWIEKKKRSRVRAREHRGAVANQMKARARGREAVDA